MRKAALVIDPDTLIELLREGSTLRVASHAIPSDAKICGVGENRWVYEGSRAAIVIVLESASFEDIPEGNIVPTLPSVKFERIDNL
jgi:hypothetical protein